MAKTSGKQSRKKPKSGRKRISALTGLIIVCIAAALGFGGLALMRSGPSTPTGGEAQDKSPVTVTPGGASKAAYEVVNSYPHDPRAFLQGLLWHNGGFYESTGLEGRSTLRRVEFPSALPAIFTGTRIAATYAAIGAVFGEWAGSEAGLGFEMQHATGQLETPRVFAIVVILTILAVLLFGLVSLVERLTIPWARGGGTMQ